MGRADLQLHSDLGDGLSSIDEILDSAERVGLDVIALTDHDDIRGAFALLEPGGRRAWRRGDDTIRPSPRTLDRGRDPDVLHSGRGALTYPRGGRGGDR